MKSYFSLCLCVAIMTGFTGCILERPVYYVSPYNGNSTAYHAMPLKKDSVKTATYAGANLYVGNANTQNTDKVFSFAGNVYQARQFGNFQAYYGADISFGNYKVTPVSSDYVYPTSDWQTLNSRAGNKSYAGAGLNGGINLTAPYGRGEWRYIGAELTTHAETGAYSSFRKELPATAADVIARSRMFSTAGLTTEIVSKAKHGSFGFKMAYGLVFGSGYGRIHAFDFNTQTFKRIPYNYFTFTFQETFHRWTGYVQVTNGTYAGGGQFGVLYRL